MIDYDTGRYSSVAEERKADESDGRLPVAAGERDPKNHYGGAP